ncbi:MAG: hypothetical protein NT075_04025 [Chloroflexi bacterium]|nr:hypothetical protein [Chloroflexota bacterium]
MKFSYHSIHAWRGKLITFAVGFIFAALLFNINSSSAQNGRALSSASTAYLTEATQRLNLLQKFYATSNGFLNSSSTLTDVIAIHGDLVVLLKTMNSQKPPSELLAYHTQFLFAAQRCENLAYDIQSYKTVEKFPPLRVAPFFIGKENCVNQIQAARLRLIDFALAYDVDMSQATLLPTDINPQTVTLTPTLGATSTATTTMAPPVEVKHKTDDLNIFYEYGQIDPDIEVVDWETHENDSGYWAVSGNLLNKSLTEGFSSVDFKIRFYKNQRVIQIANKNASGRWVHAGESFPFEFSSSVKPGEAFDRYTIEIKVMNWGKTQG